VSPDNRDIAERYMRRIRRASSGTITLVCLPHAGGAASSYFAFARSLDPAIEVVAVQYPGRQDRRLEPFAETIDELAENVTNAIAATIAGPYAIFGHSMGAVVGFEAARRLERSGAGPVRLFASGRRAPSLLRDGPLVHHGGDRVLINEIRRLSGTDQRLLDDPDMVAMILPALRNDYRAIETYRLTDTTPLNCPVSVLCGDADPQCTRAEAAAWAEHTAAGIDTRHFPGGHFYLDAQHAAVASHVGIILRRLISTISTR
jgi:surfactin synthase thioesterase subunit